MSNAALPELEKRAKNASSARWEVEMCCKVEGDLSDAQIRSKWTENPWMSVMSQTLKQEIQKGSKRLETRPAQPFFAKNFLSNPTISLSLCSCFQRNI